MNRLVLLVQLGYSCSSGRAARTGVNAAAVAAAHYMVSVKR